MGSLTLRPRLRSFEDVGLQRRQLHKSGTQAAESTHVLKADFSSVLCRAELTCCRVLTTVPKDLDVIPSSFLQPGFSDRLDAARESNQSALKNRTRLSVVDGHIQTLTWRPRCPAGSPRWKELYHVGACADGQNRLRIPGRFGQGGPRRTHGRNEEPKRAFYHRTALGPRRSIRPAHHELSGD